jgi:Domain of Unknown Function (DUF748)
MSLLEALNRGRVRRILIWALGAVALWAVLGFLVLPPVLRPVLEKRLTEILHRPARLQRLSLNPFTLSATLEGLDVKAKDGASPFFSFERLHVNLEAISLLEGGPVIREITLTKPSIAVLRNEDGTYGFQDLLDEAMKPSKKDAALRFSVNNIRVEDGSVDFDDQPKRAKHRVRGLRIGIPFLSNIASKVEISTLPALEANVNGSTFELHGKTKPFSKTRETTLDLVFHDLDLPYYLAYAPAMPSTITSGRLDARLTVAFTQPLAGPAALTLSGTSVLRKLAVAHGGKPLVACDRLDAVLGPIDVFGRKARLASLKAARPELWVRRGKSGDFEIATAFVLKTDPKEDSKADVVAPVRPPYLLVIDEAGIVDGQIRYDDLSLNAPFHAVFGNLAASVKGFSTEPGKAASLDASTKGDAGETLKAGANVVLEPLALEGALEIGGLPLKRYAGFLDSFIAFAVDDGVLDLKTNYRFSTGKDGVTTLSGLSGLSGALKSPRLRKRGEKKPFFVAPSVTIAETSVDLGARDLVLGEIASARGFLAVVRGKDGDADIAKLMAGPPKTAPVPGAAPAPEGAPWKFTLKRIALDGYTVKMEDWAVPRPARYSLTKMNLLLENVSSALGGKAKLQTRFGVDGKGAASAQGPVGFRPIFADLKVDARGIDLMPLEPYILQNLPLSLARGEVSGTGRLSFREGKEGSTRVAYTGDAKVSNFRTLDRDTKIDFLKWDSFSATGMKAGYNPMVFEVAEIAVSGAACDVSIESDGTLNLRKILGTPAPPEEKGEMAEPAAAPPATPTPAATNAAPGSKEPTEVMPIRIDVLTLQNGRIGLADHLITPSYSATLANVAGRVTGLSSRAGTVATVDLSGSLANHSPLRITGSVNPLAASASADIKIAFSDIDLPPFTPYSGKYAGYRIARGTLTMDVSYKLENQKLKAQNHFLVNQFELGEKVESKDATRLPVRLAVSLLKDGNGLIDLDLPIEGSLDDPKFRLGKVIWKVLGNLIGKAATAPFALLGKLLGGGSGQEFSYVAFADGLDALDDAARTKLGTLARALADRPGLKLNVTGRSSGEKDLEALKLLRLDRKLKAPTLDDLRQLAFARASAAKDYLAGPGKVEAARVFVRELEEKPAEPKDGAPGSRVDFSFE